MFGRSYRQFWEKQSAAIERKDHKELQIGGMHFKQSCKALHKNVNYLFLFCFIVFFCG